MNSGQGWVVGIIVVVAVVFVLSRDDKASPAKNKSSSQTYTQNERPSYPSQERPSNGSVQSSTYLERVAPLEIHASSDSDYLVKLVDASAGYTVLTVFVRRGMTADIKVPLGSYEIRYASGDTWYGYENLFGPSTGYSKADKVFNFRDTGYEISGFTITLYKVSDGNLRTQRMKPSDF